MRNNSQDSTIDRNYIQKFRFLIKEYELVKAKKHPRFRFVTDFYKAHGTNRQTFLKYYNRFKQSGQEGDLLPQKRGPKWKTRRPIPFIEHKVENLRQKGLKSTMIPDWLENILTTIARPYVVASVDLT